jgi:acylphosphatase
LAKHLVITGLVQGVGYRASFEARARALKLMGWVRNRADGSVEAIVRGEAAAVAEIIEWAHRGPAIAQVRDVSVIDVADDLMHDQDFKMLPTH